MSKMQREKGERGEREVVALFQEHSTHQAFRTPNSGGLWIPGDLSGIPGYHVEVKRQEVFDLPKWIRQATWEAAGGDVPLVCFRRSPKQPLPDPCSQWWGALPLVDLAKLL